MRPYLLAYPQKRTVILQKLVGAIERDLMLWEGEDELLRVMNFLSSAGFRVEMNLWRDPEDDHRPLNHDR